MEKIPYNLDMKEMALDLITGLECCARVDSLEQLVNDQNDIIKLQDKRIKGGDLELKKTKEKFNFVNDSYKKEVYSNRINLGEVKRLKKAKVNWIVATCASTAVAIITTVTIIK